MSRKHLQTSGLVIKSDKKVRRLDFFLRVMKLFKNFTEG